MSKENPENVKPKNKEEIDKENEQIWQEAVEKDEQPGVKLKTFDQFVSFIRTGVRMLKEHKKLEAEEDLNEEHEKLLSDLGLFIHRYGTFEKWKEERKKLKDDYNDSVITMRKLNRQYKALVEEHNKLQSEKEEWLKEKEQFEKDKVEFRKTQNELEKEKEEFEKERDSLVLRVEELEKERSKLKIFLNEEKLKVRDLTEKLKGFEDLKRRNEFLEAEVKKFNTMLGYGDVDVSEELKKKMIGDGTLNIGARFLHKGWKQQGVLFNPENKELDELFEKATEHLKRPLEAMKIRMNLTEFFNSLKKFRDEKLERYTHLFDRTENKPLNNKELKEFVDISGALNMMIDMLEKITKVLESSH